MWVTHYTKCKEHSEDVHPLSECWEWATYTRNFLFNSCSKELGPYLFHSLVNSHKSGIQLFHCTPFFCFHSWKLTLVTNKSWLKKTRPETGRSQPPERFLESSNGKWISKLLILTKCLANRLTSLLSHITTSTQSQLFPWHGSWYLLFLQLLDLRHKKLRSHCPRRDSI